MSTNTPQAPVITPDLSAFLDLKIRDMLSSLNCHQVGTVQSFNALKQTATVSLNMKLSVAGEIKSYPLLVDVPVFVLGGGNRVVTIPIRNGDTCLVLFNDRDVDNWFSTGIPSVPSSGRLHDLSDGLALVGFRSLANPVVNYSTTDVEVINGQSKISVGNLLLFKNATTDLLTVLNSVITALTLLDSVKVGASAAAAITLAQTQIQSLLKSS